jgi:hypothetical protein
MSRTVKMYNNKVGGISIKITYPHWSSKKSVEQVFRFYSDDKGIKQAKESFNKFLNKGYKEVK